jgi:hypothetical protein
MFFQAAAKENIQHSEHENSLLFLFYGSFLPPWMRIRILNAGPNPATQINADPQTLFFYIIFSR